MKIRIIAALALGAVLVSCNRNEMAQPSSSLGGSDVVAKANAPGMVPMNQSFTISGKAASLTYTYKVYAEPIIGTDVDGNQNWLAATASEQIRDVIFVTWHQNDDLGAGTISPLGTRAGAISAYKWNGTQYVYTDHVNFSQSEYYELATNLNTGTGHYEVFMAGQRDPSQSNYLLASHGGAVVTRIDYNYINDQFDASSFKQLPLPGSAATGIVAAAGSYYITTGNGIGGSSSTDAQEGGVYKTDYRLNVVSEAFGNSNIDDYQAIAIAPGATASTAVISTLDKWTSSRLRVNTQFDVANNLSTLGVGNYSIHRSEATSAVVNKMGLAAGQSAGILNTNGNIATLTDVERLGLAWAQDASDPLADANLLIAAGDWGLYSAKSFDPNAATPTYPEFLGNYGYCTNVEYDAVHKLIYYCAGSGGLPVLAGADYNGGVLINQGDLIGYFVPVTGTGLPTVDDYLNNGAAISLPTRFVVKDVSTYNTPGGQEMVVVTSGEGGVYFVEKD